MAEKGAITRISHGPRNSICCRPGRGLKSCTVLSMSAVLALMLLITAGCEGSQPNISKTPEYKAGYQSGLNEGLRIGDTYQHGYNDGYAEGFRAARPGRGGHLTGLWKYVAVVAAYIGMVKILGALIIFTLALIFESANGTEIFAKIFVSNLALIVLYWLSYSLTIGFSGALEGWLLRPGAEGGLEKIILGLFGAFGMYMFLWLLELLGEKTEGHRVVQSICIFASTFATAVLIGFFYALHKVPDIHIYLFFDVILGVVMGGVLFIVRTLLRLSDETPSAPQDSSHSHGQIMKQIRSKPQQASVAPRRGTEGSE